jgi:hypothetical protein
MKESKEKNFHREDAKDAKKQSIHFFLRALRVFAVEIPLPGIFFIIHNS